MVLGQLTWMPFDKFSLLFLSGLVCSVQPCVLLGVIKNIEESKHSECLIPFDAFSQQINTNTMVKINERAPVTCSKQIVIKADKAKVWEVLTNIEQWPSWQTDISRTKLNGPLQENITFNWTSGGANISSTLHTIDEERILGWTGKSMGIFAIHNWIISEVEAGTLVQVEESMEGILASIFKGALHKSLETGMVNWLSFLKAECEQTS